MITHKRLLEILSYNKQTGEFTWKQRSVNRIQDKAWNKRHAGKLTGYTRKNGYKVINILYKEYPCSRLAWFYVYGKWPNGEIDHINGLRHDDRIINLREANRSENAINRGLQSNNSTGFKGVWKRKNSNSWVAEIAKKGKRVKLGSFKSPEAAYEAYIKAAREIHGEFAKL